MLIVPTNLTQAEYDRFHNWYDKNEFDVLVRLIESKALTHEVECANHMVVGTESAKKEAEAQAKLARECRATLEILRAFRVDKKLSTAKAVPTPITPNP